MCDTCGVYDAMIVYCSQLGRFGPFRPAPCGLRRVCRIGVDMHMWGAVVPSSVASEVGVVVTLTVMRTAIYTSVLVSTDKVLH